MQSNFSLSQGQYVLQCLKKVTLGDNSRNDILVLVSSCLSDKQVSSHYLADF